MNSTTLRFIREHLTDDVHTLALQVRRYPDVDMPAALTQIAGRQAAAQKLPLWHACEDLRYPPHLPLEQCSSEATARYKARILPKADSLVDLTGGFGVDCAFLSECVKRTVYVERNEELCRTAAHNFPLLGCRHIKVVNSDAIVYLEQMPPVDCIYLDPARRNGQGSKVIAVADCEPDVARLQPLLLQKARHVLIKLSPMLDLTQALSVMTQTEQVHIVAVGNECKELLLLLGHSPMPTEEVPIHCVNLPHTSVTASDLPQSFTFTRRQESNDVCRYAATPRTYLYEPNAALLKAGAFRSIACRYDLEKLAVNTHLYTSDRLITDFPGRCFHITGSCAANKKELKALLGEIDQANLTVRNFPASVAELRRKLRLAEGGYIYLFATTLRDGQKILIAGEKFVN
ncbi:MAG: class I SAM-dependent methyltransferase [Prevotellaceae bacterium]|jgi:16S rRNA G966 N2-methylase RsmD|nr:class I SAM-dependent methyltransferase [Prevotellaceae bacterium]